VLDTLNVLETNKINELDALVSLIDEPNEEMFHKIRHKVLSYGNLAIPVLEEAWVNTLGDHDSVRIEGLIEEIRRNELVANFHNWQNDNTAGLWDGYSILMRYLNPAIELERCDSVFEKLVKEIWLELNENLTALEKIKVINHVLFAVNGFNAITTPQAKPDSFFLNRLIDQKSANPFTLGILYISIAQSLDIPVFGVDLPGHFILVFIDEKGKVKQSGQYTEDDVMFYINPANNGAVFTHNEVRHYISQMKLEELSEYFRPTSNANVIKRIAKEMIVSYDIENNDIKKDGLARLLPDN